MGLRETLEAATRECAPDDLQCVFMRDWANEVLADRNHEIVALVLDMGEELRAWKMSSGDFRQVVSTEALLARLDRLGRNDDDGKEQT